MKLIYIYILLVLVLYSVSFSQVRSSGMQILVKDKTTGISFINDTMTVTINDTAQAILISDNEGYMYMLKPPGRYSVEVAHKGYKSLEFRGINVTEGSTTAITLELSLEDPPTKNKKKKKGGVKLKMIKQ